MKHVIKITTTTFYYTTFYAKYVLEKTFVNSEPEALISISKLCVVGDGQFLFKQIVRACNYRCYL